MIDCVFSLWPESGSLPLPRLFAGPASHADGAVRLRCASCGPYSGGFIEPNQGESPQKPQKPHVRSCPAARLWLLYEQTFPESLDGPEPLMPTGQSSTPQWPYRYGVTKSGVVRPGCQPGVVDHNGRPGHRKEPRPLDMQYESIGSFYARRIPPLNYTHPLTALGASSKMPPVADNGQEKPQEHEPEREEGEEEDAGEKQPDNGEKEQQGGDNHNEDEDNDNREKEDGQEGGRDDNGGEDGKESGGGEKGNEDEPNDIDEDATESEGQEDDMEDDTENDRHERLVKKETRQPDPVTDDEHGLASSVAVHEQQPEYVHETDNDTIVVKFEPPSADSDMQIDDDDVDDNMTQEMPDDLLDELLEDSDESPAELAELAEKSAEQVVDLVEPPANHPPAKQPTELQPDEPVEPMEEDEDFTILDVHPASIQTLPHSSFMSLQRRQPRQRRPKQKPQKPQNLLQPQPRPLLVTSPLAERQALLRRRPLLQPRPQTVSSVLPHMVPQQVLSSTVSSTMASETTPKTSGRMTLKPSLMPPSSTPTETVPRTPLGSSRPSILQPRPPPLLRINAQVAHDPDDPGSARTPAGMDAFWESALQRLHQQKQKQLLMQTIPQLPLPLPLPPPTSTPTPTSTSMSALMLTQPRSALRSLQPRPHPLPRTRSPTSVPQQPLPPPKPNAAPKVTISPPAYLVSSPDGTLMNAYEYRQQARTQAIEAARDRMRRLQSGEPLLTSRRGPLAASSNSSSSSHDAGHVATNTERNAESSEVEVTVVDQAELAPDSAALPLPGAYRGRPCPCCNMYIRRDRNILPEEDYGREERRKDYIPISLLYDMLPRPPKGYPFFDE